MLKEKLKKYKIILASGSPRRQQFFKDLDLDFEIRLKDVEEIYPPELKAVEITDFLAQLKADAFKDELKENEILVTSDTIVWHQNKALGKPKSAEDAFEMIKSMSGTTHEVITSVCFQTNTASTLLHDITKVTFKDLSDEAILFYIENYKPYDKAGAYGIQEWFGFMAVTKVEGSYTNVMGLPTAKVYEYLSTLV
ncbi:septum formation protein Maf [Flavobacterium sp. WLB]|uniref:Maf-like protein n=1 Tax=unclassified Flavobacterium TaxID=196869 RepID=UPI0006AB7FE6|nr:MULTISPECIES: Maf-like protein [unclassified Flavobacterium]KOP35990.1 septum formation inhibitor Maf [Flavobacterium sp. VMW]OWU89689.1 septum formation inhibitor Maf [Flavobacterium sp. NLM]PUU68316.1 septum formation protein Maf [Flavobacterium sp. WLB]